MVKASEGDTAYIMRSIGNPSRVARNPLAEKVMEMEARGTTIEELLPVIGARANAAFDEGDVENSFLSLGQCVGLIHDVPTVKEFIDRVVEEAVEARDRLKQSIP